MRQKRKRFTTAKVRVTVNLKKEPLELLFLIKPVTVRLDRDEKAEALVMKMMERKQRQSVALQGIQQSLT